MQSPSMPSNEEERLYALRCLNILDTAAEERFDRITRIARQVFQVPIALISLIDKDRQWFKSREGLEIDETPRNLSFCGHAILQDELMLVEDAHLDQRFFDNPYVTQDPNIRSYLGCPIKVKKELNIGTICLLDSKPRKFTAEEQNVLRDLGAMIEAELNSLHLSTTDELTGLSNRRGFLTIGEYIFSLCKRNNYPMALLFFDLNKFKSINDTFGHHVGDEVLKEFAQALLNIFRQSDVIARLGGDEFCILCSKIEESHIQGLLARCQEQINLLNLDNRPYKIEYSVGSVFYDAQKHATLQDLLNEADAYMYTDKLR